LTTAVKAVTGQRLHLVSSSGGHLELLAALLPAFAGHERTWVTAESSRARAIEASGEQVEIVSFYGRNPLRLIRHLKQVVALFLDDLPNTVVTTGAGTAVPFCVLARLLGANIIFIETMARVRDSSISGRILTRLASRSMVQWPEMLRVYREARLCRPELLRDVRVGAPAPGEGTFVSVGTHVSPFDRLLAAVDQAVDQGVLPGPAVGQAGVSTYAANKVSLEPFMSPDDIAERIRRCRYVVCHAGCGIISAALREGRRPLVMPRLKRYGEHVDDHQLQIVEKLAAMDLVVPLDGPIGPEDVAAAERPLRDAALDASAALPSVEEALSEALRRTATQTGGHRKSRVPASVDRA
jgi:UDP-N-acetylglucosamine--N-acetylmuramyl-(pentapeptide) pyrophosphoryl-undecaprenol N-acetylglucosamine transferase